MAIANTKDIDIQGSLGGEVIDMSIEETSLNHIMSILADLYSDPTEAIIREYITNAIDSHIAAGQSRPIEISTPNKLNQFFVVKDFGVGLSVEDMRNIYAKFGASTKRQTNDQAGMLGLGAKSALTYGDQFTVTSVKNGIKTLVVVSRSADGAGHLEIVDSSPSDEHNGVTISIPVNTELWRFENKLHEFVQYISDGLALLDGSPVGGLKNFRKLSDELYIQENGGRDRVVMGNVSYPIVHPTKNRILRGLTTVVIVPIGTVDFTPSREELMYTSHTNATLDRIYRDFSGVFSEYLNEKMEECETFLDAYNTSQKLYDDYDEIIQNGQLKWNDVALETRYQNASQLYWARGGKLKKSEARISSELTKEKTVLVYNTPDNMFSTQQRKLDKWLQEKEYGELYPNRGNVYLLGKEHELFDQFKSELDHVYDWNLIKKVEVEPAAKKKDRTYNVLVKSNVFDRFIEQSDYTLDSAHPIIFAANKECYYEHEIMRLVPKESQYVWVIPSHQDNFKKKYPKAVHAYQQTQTLVTDYLNSLTDADKALFVEKKSTYSRWMNYINADQILDPELVDEINLDKPGSDQVKAVEKLRTMKRLNGMIPSHMQIQNLPDVKSVHKDASQKYTLLHNVYHQTGTMIEIRAALTDYINTIYLANNDK